MQAARFLAMVVVVVGLGCGGGGGGGGESSATVADFACDKAVSCEVVPAAYRSYCMEQAKPMDMYVVDPAAAIACLEPQMTCEAIAELQTADPNSPPAWLKDCLAYDTSSFQCSQDKKTLHFCNTSQACKDLSCEEGCQYAYGVGAIGCGVTGQATYPRCICG